MTSVAPKQTLPDGKRHVKAIPSRDPGIAELAKKPFEMPKESLPGSYPETPGNEPDKISFPSTGQQQQQQRQQGKGTSVTDPSRTGVGKPITVSPEHQRTRENEQVGIAADQNKFKKPAPRAKEFERYSKPDESSTGVGRPITVDPTAHEGAENKKGSGGGPVLASSGTADKSRFEPTPRGEEFERYSTPDERSTGVARPISLDPTHDNNKENETETATTTAAGPVLATSGAADQNRFKPAPREKEFEQYSTPDDPSTGVARPITLDPMQREKDNEMATTTAGPVLAASGAADENRFKPAPREKEFEQFTTPDDPSTGVARPITLDPLEKEKENEKTPVVLAASGVSDQNKFKPAPRGEEFQQYSTPDDPSTGVARPITLQAGQTAAESPGQGTTTPTPERFPEASDPASTGVGKPITLDPFEKADTELYGVSPIPASSGVGNPVTLKPGEKVPHPGDVTANTVHSTARTDREAYEKDASAFIAPGIVSSASLEREIPPTSTDLDPDNIMSSRRFSGRSLDSTGPGAGGEAGGTAVDDDGDWQSPSTESTSLPRGRRLTDTGVAIQSVAPTATTAELAGGVPKEERATTSRTAGAAGAAAVPDAEIRAVKKTSSAKPDEATTTTTTTTTTATTSRGHPDEEVPGIVKESLDKAHKDPEAAGSHEAVEEKREVEDELLRYVSPDESAGTPAPTTSAASMEKAPRPTAAPGAETKKEEEEQQPHNKRISTTAPTAGTTAAGTTTGPSVTTGVADSKTSKLSTAPREEDKAISTSVPPKEEYQSNLKGQGQQSKDATTSTASTGPAAAAAAAAASQANHNQNQRPGQENYGTTKPTTAKETKPTTAKESKPTTAKETTADGNTNNAAASSKDDSAETRERKRKHRGSGLFGKIKDMLK